MHNTAQHDSVFLINIPARPIPEDSLLRDRKNEVRLYIESTGSYIDLSTCLLGYSKSHCVLKDLL